MDQAKLEKMREIGMRVVKTCATCCHRPPVGVHWGECSLHHYQHGKHTRARAIPAHDFLVCESWEAHEQLEVISGLGAYATEPWLENA
jgi:hypothetical protein